MACKLSFMTIFCGWHGTSHVIYSMSYWRGWAKSNTLKKEIIYLWFFTSLCVEIHSPPPPLPPSNHIPYLKSENSRWFQIALFYFLPSEIIKCRRHVGWRSSFRLLGTDWWEGIVFQGSMRRRNRSHCGGTKALLLPLFYIAFNLWTILLSLR